MAICAAAHLSVSNLSVSLRAAWAVPTPRTSMVIGHTNPQRERARPPPRLTCRETQITKNKTTKTQRHQEEQSKSVVSDPSMIAGTLVVISKSKHHAFFFVSLCLGGSPL
jgi:hypothetical protein